VPSQPQTGRRKRPSLRLLPDQEKFDQRRGERGAAENEVYHVHARRLSSESLAREFEFVMNRVEIGVRLIGLGQGEVVF
jgi:hypothetical protein